MSSETSEEKYNLVFRGALAKGVALDAAKRNMGQLFKIDAAKVEALFSGKAVVLKRGLAFDAATKYRVAIKKAGALVDVEVQVAAAGKPQGKASFGAFDVQPPSFSAPSGVIPCTEPAVGAIPGTEVPAKVEVGLVLAPMEGHLIAAQERPVVETVEVDISALSLKESGGNLLEASEYEQDSALELDLTAFNIAEAGAELLKPEERKSVKAVDVDISSLSVAELGGNLAPPKPVSAPAPDVSGITLLEP
ncbi:hypothetical protein [Teredinibacter purpureus]|uniref:hypothetical protein n=1 Tax=Teredinibacter purpureus TaxID=2731756 RepID=UPI0005F88BA2|nr:hypothetical protein [Teredinibacter purpureus]